MSVSESFKSLQHGTIPNLCTGQQLLLGISSTGVKICLSKGDGNWLMGHDNKGLRIVNNGWKADKHFNC